jgi:hypothetical protein
MPAILIIGEDPAGIDFDAPDAPEGVTADSIRAGLEDARDRLNAAGHQAEILWTHAPDIAAEAREALGRRRWDVVVVGAGLRTLPPMAQAFETLMNVVHETAPGARLAFNSNPADSDVAALRQVAG